MQIHLLVLHRLPQALDEHIVPPGAIPIHAELALLFPEGLHNLMRVNWLP